MAGIFISYRRSDTAPYAGRLSDGLREAGFSVFLDLDLEPGVDFVRATASAIDDCDALLALIGPSWVTVARDGRRRLHDPDDKVRLELASALRQRARVIPVLVGGAVMPGRGDLPEDLESFAHLNAFELHDGTWHDDLRRLGAILERKAVESRPAGGKAAPGPNPYRGLAAFREEDAELFFGRERFTAELAAAVLERPLVAVVGASGSGKSSLVFAGLIPQLRREPGWLIAPLRPGRHPFLSLAAALGPLLEGELGEVARLEQTSRLGRALEAGELPLWQVAGRILELHRAERLLLVIDQFEELYTLGESLSGAAFDPRPFIDQLLGLFAQPGSPVVVLLTLRADFMAAALGYRPLVDHLQEGQVLLGPMNEDELRAVIEKPAQARGVTFESGLVERILQDIASQEGSLPLLEFALAQLWERQRRGVLTHQAYDAVGMVEQALARHADLVYEGLEAAEREAAQRIFLQLVNPGEGQEDTRRVATRAELGEGRWRLVTELATARLLVAGRNESGDETAEVIHEALIRTWQVLRRWIDENRTFLIWRKRLLQALKGWEESGHDEGDLLRGFRLEEAREQLAGYGAQLSSSERSFIDASIDLKRREDAEMLRRREERERLQRQSSRRLQVFLVVAVVLAALAGWQGLQATGRGRALTRTLGEVQQERDRAVEAEAAAVEARQQAETQARINLARQLGAQALAAAQNPDPTSGYFDRAVLLAVQAVRVWDSRESYDNLFRVLQNGDLYFIPLGAHDDWVTSVAFSPDGRFIASGSADGLNRTMLGSGTGMIRIWNAVNRQAVGEVLRGHDGHFVTGLLFSPDARSLISIGGDPAAGAILWSVPDSSLVASLGTSPDTATSAALSPDGTVLALATQRELEGLDPALKRYEILLWDLAAGRRIGLLTGHEGTITAVAFSPDGALLASGSSDTTVRLWSPSELGPVGEPLEEHLGTVTGVAFSPDGTLLATGSRDGALRLWDAARLSPVGGSLQGPAGGVTAVAFSPDGQVLAASGGEGAIALWDVSGRRPLGEPLRGHAGAVLSLAFSPDGSALVSGGEDASARFWGLASPIYDVLRGHPSGVSSLAFSPDGNRLASGGADGSIRLWEVAGGSQVQVLQGHRGPVGALGFDPAGETLVSGGADRRLLSWNLAIFGDRSPTELRRRVDALARSPDGTLVTASLNDRLVVLGDVDPAGGTVASGLLRGHLDTVESAAFNADGNLLASGGKDRQVILWDVVSRAPVGQPWTAPSEVSEVAFTADGTRLAVGGRDGGITLFTVAGDDVSGVSLPGHDDAVTALAFSPEGDLLVSGAADGTLVFWDVASRTLRGEPFRGFGGAVSSLAFSPDGKTLASGSDDATIVLWTVDPAAWLERACRAAGRNLTREEWRRFLGDTPYQPTCPQFPEGT